MTNVNQETVERFKAAVRSAGGRVWSAGVLIPADPNASGFAVALLYSAKMGGETQFSALSYQSYEVFGVGDDTAERAECIDRLKSALSEAFTSE